MTSKWSLICLATTLFWVWFLLGYSVFAIAYASYGMGIAHGVQCRDDLSDKPIWLTDKTAGTLLCEYPLGHHKTNDNIDQYHKHAGDDIITTTTAALKPQCHAELQSRFPRDVPKHAEKIKCSNSIFAFPAPWNRAFWAGIALFASYWVLFGLILETMAVEACREAFDEVREMDDGSSECGDEKARLIVKERYTT